MTFFEKSTIVMLGILAATHTDGLIAGIFWVLLAVWAVSYLDATYLEG